MLSPNEVRSVREAVRSSLTDWVTCLWGQGFDVERARLITLEFDPNRWPEISEAKALWWFRQLVDHLNFQMCVGQGPGRYKRRWGHSYFSYVVGVERHQSGQVHLHFCTDNFIGYRDLHDWWNSHCGFAWTSARRRDVSVFSTTGDGALKYVLKYVLKSGAVPLVWIQRRRVEVRRLNMSFGPAPSEVRATAEPVKGAVPGARVTAVDAKQLRLALDGRACAQNLSGGSEE